MPSSASGVMFPSDIVEPISPNVTYEKPAGSASTKRPSWSAIRCGGPYPNAASGAFVASAERAVSRSSAAMLAMPAAPRARNARRSRSVIRSPPVES
jgi:hypothetical protein